MMKPEEQMRIILKGVQTLVDQRELLDKLTRSDLLFSGKSFSAQDSKV